MFHRWTEDEAPLERSIEIRFHSTPYPSSKGRVVAISLTLADLLWECEKLAGSKLAVIDLLLDAVGKDMEKLIFDLAHERAKASDLPADTA